MPYPFISDGALFLYTFPMKELMETLKIIGIPARERKYIRAYYRDDPEGLREYVLYMRAMLDDRNEYI